MARCVLVLALGRGLLAAEDVAGLLQQGIAVTALTKDVPDPGPDGFLMDRVSSYAEPGSKIEFSLGKTCSEPDQGGSKTCSMRWGDAVKGQCKLHVPGGIHRGDTLVSGVSMHMQPQNPSDPAAALFPKAIDFTQKCQVCTGSCVAEGQTEETRFYVSGPTPIVDEAACSSDQVTSIEDFTLMDINGSLPSLESLMLDGTATMSMGLLKADGTKRVEGSYALKAKSRRGTPSHTPVSLASILAERIAGVISASAETQEQREAMRRAAARPQRRGLEDESPGFLGIAVTIRHKESSATTFGLKSTKGCETTDENGSMKCKLPMNSKVDLSSILHLKGTFDEGSMARIKLKTKVGGVMGALMSTMMPPIGIEVPLCGKATDVSIMGQSIHIEPARCGDYELLVESLKPSLVPIPDLISTALPATPGMPFMPKSLKELLPLEATLAVDIRHKGGTPMLTAEVALSATK